MVLRGNFAVYQGREFKASHNHSKGIISLYSYDPQDTSLGFVEIRQGFFLKQLRPSDIQYAYDITTYAEYGGYKFEVEKLEDEKVLLFYPGMDSKIIEGLGFRFIEPFVFEKEVRKEEVTRIWQEKDPLWGYSLPPEE